MSELRTNLAEKILGWTWVRQDDCRHFYRYPGISLMALPESHWFPDEDVNQALRCLETWAEKTSGEWTIHRRNVDGQPAYNIHLEPWPGEGTEVSRLFDGPLPKAICLAISQAMGWSEPPP